MNITKFDLGVHKDVWHLNINHENAFVMINQSETPIPRIAVYEDTSVIELISQGKDQTDDFPHPVLVIQFATPEILSGFAQMIAMVCEKYAEQNNIALPEGYEDDKEDLKNIFQRNLN